MNYQLFELINSRAGRIDLLDDLMAWAAVWLLLVLAALAVVPARLALRPGSRIALARVAASLLLAFVVGQVVARLNHELRPFQSHVVHQLIPHDGGVSLPSDHATAAFALAFAVGAFLSRRWGLVLIVLATVLGFARIWTGVHYPGDILAGALIGAAAVAVVVFVERLWRKPAGGASPSDPAITPPQPT